MTNDVGTVAVDLSTEGSRLNSTDLPPTYVVRLSLQHVHGFAGVQELHLADTLGRVRQWTLILGNNGTGKTSLLRSIAAMEPRYWGPDKHHTVPRVFGPIEGSDPFPQWLKRAPGEEDVTISATFVSGQIAPWGETAGELEEVVSRYVLHGTGNRNRAIASTSTIDTAKVGGLAIFGYGATRRMGSTSLSESYSDDPTASLFSDDVALVNAEEWLLQADYSDIKSKNRRKKSRFAHVREILLGLLPDVEDIRISADKPRNRPTAEFLTPSGWVPVAGLGLGYRTVIAWMVDLASRLFDRYPKSKNPLAEAAVVLIDEIDLHLHPKWQRTIMRYLSERFPGTQFIATAHSPLVVQSARDANLVLLQRYSAGVEINNDPEVVENWRVDQILTSVFELPSARPIEVEPLLQAREAILAKKRLTKADERELERLNSEIGPLPTGETPSDIAAMDIIRRAARAIEEQHSGV